MRIYSLSIGHRSANAFSPGLISGIAVPYLDSIEPLDSCLNFLTIVYLCNRAGNLVEKYFLNRRLK